MSSGTSGRKAGRTPTGKPPGDREVDVLERGHIFFFYRPKVDRGVARGIDDIRRIYIILRPHRRRIYRLLVVPAKRLPEPSGGGDRTAWAFVEAVTRKARDVEDLLDPEVYPTKTRGERHLPAARPAGEGVYTIARHGNHTHLAYALELPQTPGEVQQVLNLLRTGAVSSSQCARRACDERSCS